MSNRKKCESVTQFVVGARTANGRCSQHRSSTNDQSKTFITYSLSPRTGSAPHSLLPTHAPAGLVDSLPHEQRVNEELS